MKEVKILEDFMTSKQLYFLNEDSSDTTFSNCIGKSNIDLTIANSQLLRSITGWEISSQESLSDHRYIKFQIILGLTRPPIVGPQTVRYRTNAVSLGKFQGTVLQTLAEKFKLTHRPP
jgi:hypothetical protein